MYFAGGFGIKDVQDFFATNVHYCIGTVWTVLLPCPSCDAVIMSLSSPHAPAKPLYHNCSSSHLLVQMDLFSFKNWYQELEFVFSPPSTSHLSSKPTPGALPLSPLPRCSVCARRSKACGVAGHEPEAGVAQVRRHRRGGSKGGGGCGGRGREKHGERED